MPASATRRANVSSIHSPERRWPDGRRIQSASIRLAYCAFARASLVAQSVGSFICFATV